MKIAVSGERLGRALPSTLNISINYFRPVSVNGTLILNETLNVGLVSYNHLYNVAKFSARFTHNS